MITTIIIIIIKEINLITYNLKKKEFIIMININNTGTNMGIKVIADKKS